MGTLPSLPALGTGLVLLAGSVACETTGVQNHTREGAGQVMKQDNIARVRSFTVVDKKTGKTIPLGQVIGRDPDSYTIVEGPVVEEVPPPMLGR